MIKGKNEIRLKRKVRVRKMLLTRSDLPRLVVTRSNQHFYAQIIDGAGKVLASASSTSTLPTPEVSRTRGSSGVSGKFNKTEQASQLGVQLATKAVKAKIGPVVLDRGYYRFHGRVKAFVESARTAGLKI